MRRLFDRLRDLRIEPIGADISDNGPDLKTVQDKVVARAAELRQAWLSEAESVTDLFEHSAVRRKQRGLSTAHGFSVETSHAAPMVVRTADAGEPNNPSEQSIGALGRTEPVHRPGRKRDEDRPCPKCGRNGDIEDFFGFRMVNGKRIRQSYCRDCRSRSS